ncbi:MAG: hypothetical protein ACLFRT_11395, partial [Actinomycetota bacterium]
MSDEPAEPARSFYGERAKAGVGQARPGTTYGEEWMMNRRAIVLMAALAMALMLMPSAGADERFEFEPMVYDLAATPSGSILVGENAGAVLGVDPGDVTVKEIRRGGVDVLTELDLPTVINGLDAIGRGNFFLTTGGSDLAQDGALWRVSPGSTRMVADLAAFERENDPD